VLNFCSVASPAFQRHSEYWKGKAIDHMKDSPSPFTCSRPCWTLGERTRRHRLSLVLAVALLAASSLVACGGTTGNASSSTSGGGTGQPELSSSVSSISFGNVVIGNTNSQPITLSNTGNAGLTISGATISGSGFSMTGIPAPLTLAAGQSSMATVNFAPQGTGNVTGSISFVSNASTSAYAISLSGTGLAANAQLSANPTSLSLGNVALKSTSTQTFTLTDVGNSSVNVSQIGVSGTGFSTSGPTLPLTLSPGQSTNVSVVFAPTGYGSFTGSVSIESSATNSPAIVSLSGSSHAEVLTWNASTSTVVGYNVYRGTQSGGPYGTKMNSSLIPSTTFTDTSVQAGQTLFYVVTAVDSSGVESDYSDQMSATVHSP
jgi:hypothetical protein